MDMITDKLKKVKLLLLDVDGILTDGGIIYDDCGRETKKFNSKDGLGIRLLMDLGIGVGIITGRSSEALNHRCKNLGITMIYDGIKDKVKILEKILIDTDIPAENVAYMGDDLPDLPLFSRVGLSATVSDAHHVVREHAMVVTPGAGGCGGVRDLCDRILKAQGVWDATIEKYL